MTAVSSFEPSHFPPFEGHPVTMAGAKMSNQNRVLTRAAHVEGLVLQVGDVITVAIRCEVQSIDHRPINNNEGELNRVPMLVAKEATLSAGEEADNRVNATLARYQALQDGTAGPGWDQPQLSAGE